MILFCILAQLAWSSIKVNSPSELREQYSKGLESSLGNFGNPPYGSFIFGTVWYKSGVNGCSPIHMDDNYDEVDTLIVMFDRGDCAFVLKVKHAQDVGAKAVLIANNVEGQDVKKIVMKDNGLGGNLFIPAMLISFYDGNNIKKFIQSNGVSLSLGFEMPSSDGQVQISLVLSSFGQDSLKVAKLFKGLEDRLNAKNTNLVAHYVVLQCMSCKNGKFSKEENDCLGGGRYCAPDPDGMIGSLNGRMVIEEDLRQLCVLQSVKSEKSDYSLYFDYLAEFGRTCYGKKFTKDCSTSAMKSVGVNSKSVSSCVDNSFTGTETYTMQENSKLAAEVSYWNDYGLAFYPAILINEQVYKGDIEESAVLTAICAGYYSGTQPQFCDEHKNKDKEEKGIETKTVVIGLILFFGILVALLLAYRVYAKRELQHDMRAQVNSAVNQYFALSDTSGFKDRQLRRLD